MLCHFASVRLSPRDIWEAFRHQFGVLVLCMLLKPETTHESELKMTPPVNREYRILWCPSSQELWRHCFLRIDIGSEMRKEAHEGISTDFANDVPRLFVRLDLTRSTLCRVLFAIALACLLGLGALYVVSIRRCRETGKRCPTFPLPIPPQGTNQRSDERTTIVTKTF
jgi:hypothetical protein